MRPRIRSPLLSATLLFTILVIMQCHPTSGDDHNVVSYDELESLNVSCDPVDTCRTNRSSDSLERYNCMCGTACVHMGTCCADSPLSNMAHIATAECLEVHGGKTFYIVGTCSPGWSDDGLVERMCKNNGEDISDPFLIIPVTSRESGITYKNYFCAVCGNEQEEDLSFWNIQLSMEERLVRSESIPYIFYNNTIGTWVMTSAEDDIEEPVIITPKIPPGLEHLVQKCNPDLVSTCSANWTDGELATKCGAYMAMVVFRRGDGGMVWYKNPHCAICNHEDVLERSCYDLRTLTRVKPTIDWRKVFFIGLFVLDRGNEECEKNMVYDGLAKACRIARCDKSMMYDALAKKCRNVRCVNKDMVFRDRKCVLRDA